MVDHILARGAISFEQPVDLRDHIARDQVPAFQRVVAIGPVMCEAKHGAEPARRGMQLADRGDQIVGRADHRRRAVDEGGLVHRMVGRGELLRARPHQRADGIFVVPLHQPGARLGARLFARLGDVPAHQHAPIVAADALTRLLRGLLGKAPLRRQRGEPRVRVRPDRQGADAVFPRQHHARRADRGSDDERHVLLQRKQLQPRILQREPVALVRDALAREQPADHPDRLVLPVALGHRIDAKHIGVGRQRSGPGAENDPPARHVVELHDALRDVERMVIGQRDDAGAQLDALRPLAHRGQEQFGRGNHFPSRRVMLADPEFVEAKLVEMHRQFDVAAHLEHRMLADRMVGRDECAELQSSHGLPFEPDRPWRPDRCPDRSRTSDPVTLSPRERPDGARELSLFA